LRYCEWQRKRESLKNKEKNELGSLHESLDDCYDGTERKVQKGSSQGIEASLAITACQRKKEKDSRKKIT
jgi:hypothetical protein